ncbi:MAG: phosphoribosyltransferase family protein, partial [Chloroflexota bacterium]
MTTRDKRLAAALRPYESPETVILAVRSGGVPVAIEFAKALRSPLDVVVTRKIPVPGNPEAGYGTVAADGTVFLNGRLATQLGSRQQQIEHQRTYVLAGIERTNTFYREWLPQVSLAGKTVIITDDGLASGFTIWSQRPSLSSDRRQTALWLP